jgi:hypothetical protein
MNILRNREIAVKVIPPHDATSITLSIKIVRQRGIQHYVEFRQLKSKKEQSENVMLVR